SLFIRLSSLIMERIDTLKKFTSAAVLSAIALWGIQGDVNAAPEDYVKPVEVKLVSEGLVSSLNLSQSYKAISGNTTIELSKGNYSITRGSIISIKQGGKTLIQGKE